MKFKTTGPVTMLVFWLALQGCSHKNSRYAANPDQFTNDSAKIAADEAFEPILDDEFYVLEALNHKVHPRMIYRPENQAVNMLLGDSVRIAILSRRLTSAELAALSEKTLTPTIDRFAVDAVALIVNKSSSDTVFSVSGIKDMLNGKSGTDKQIIFDNPNSGMVAYLKEFSGSKSLSQKNIFSLKSNKEVIKYVSEHPNAIGITDFSWLIDPDKDDADIVGNVKVASINDDTNKKLAGKYFAPSQTTIALKQYPLTRNLYIINCTGSMSLGKKVADFVKSERGQLIVLKSGLLPDNIPDRQVEIIKK
ncbi:MAG TPA: substrate-binding domain-containing protein [Mucilaginibacter sp.]|nr:substrate-binding domain-containing protein [Mucilaginibacter sp.]